MTVSYTGKVANVRFGGFVRLLFHWRGSIYKLVYRELAVFLVLYAAISLTYRYGLNDASKRVFESVVNIFKGFTDLIPLTFVVGFYVSLVVTRWWNQYLHVPWPDPMMIRIGSLVHGADDRGRMIRRTLMRYMALSSTLLFCSISLPVKKRFPTLDHIVEAGIMTPREKKIYEEELHSQHNKYWIPLMWFSTLAVQARKENRIDSDMNLHLILNGLEDFRGWCGGLFSYDWISTPLVYTQVVTLVTYTFFLTTLISRQSLDPSQGIEGHEVDIYVPVFTILQFIFYMGWVKVAEQLMNPFGEDDDDFDSNWLIDRNIQVSYLAVDEMYCNNPPVEQDIWWDEIEPDIPYTTATVKQANARTEFLGSTAQLSLESEDMQIVSPMETIPEDIPEEEESIANGILARNKDKSEISRLIRRQSNESPTPTERTNHTTKSRKTGSTTHRQYESNASIEKSGLRMQRLPDNVNFGIPVPLQDGDRNRSFLSQISDWTAYLNPLERDRRRQPSRSTSPTPSLTTQASSKRRHRVFGEPRRPNDRFDIRSVRTISVRGDSITDLASRRSDDDEDDVSHVHYDTGKDVPEDLASIAPSMSQSVKDHYPRRARSIRQESMTSGASTPTTDFRRKISAPVPQMAPSTLVTPPSSELSSSTSAFRQAQSHHTPHATPGHTNAFPHPVPVNLKPLIVPPVGLQPGSTLHLGTPAVMPQQMLQQQQQHQQALTESQQFLLQQATALLDLDSSRTLSGVINAPASPSHNFEVKPASVVEIGANGRARNASGASYSSPASTPSSRPIEGVADHHRTRLSSGSAGSQRHSFGAKDAENLQARRRTGSGSASSPFSKRSATTAPTTPTTPSVVQAASAASAASAAAGATASSSPQTKPFARSSSSSSTPSPLTSPYSDATTPLLGAGARRESAETPPSTPPSPAVSAATSAAAPAAAPTAPPATPSHSSVTFAESVVTIDFTPATSAEEFPSPEPSPHVQAPLQQPPPLLPPLQPPLPPIAQPVRQPFLQTVAEIPGDPHRDDLHPSIIPNSPTEPSPQRLFPNSPLVVLPPSPTTSLNSVSTSKTLTPTDAESPVEAAFKSSALDSSATTTTAKKTTKTTVDDDDDEDDEALKIRRKATTSSVSLASTEDGSGSEHNTITKSPSTTRPGILGLFDPIGSLLEDKDKEDKVEEEDMENKGVEEEADEIKKRDD